ncbi:hypothetical protein [Desulfosporosinus sp. Sb-LF]|uniref:hypothetical protein n=1 Tax=Desulfosporosinus sp. Sb-LF TaxID=2560027 RepID=UPI0018EE55EA|nr:hypothetical protein [Desulfosporosinus sp. Sb-LF]
MRIVKVCHACDRIIGEIELDDLTGHNADPIMDIVGNIAYELCPGCLHEMEMEPSNVYH